MVTMSTLNYQMSASRGQTSSDSRWVPGWFSLSWHEHVSTHYRCGWVLDVGGEVNKTLLAVTEVTEMFWRPCCVTERHVLVSAPIICDHRSRPGGNCEQSVLVLRCSFFKCRSKTFSFTYFCFLSISPSLHLSVSLLPLPALCQNKKKKMLQ